MTAGSPESIKMPDSKLQQFQQLNYECTQFVNLEAELLDSRRFQDWFKLLSKDIEYKVPVRVTRDRGKDEFTNDYHFNDGWESLKARVDRLNLEHAWAENPPTRTLRLVSNVRVADADAETVTFKNKFIIYRGFWDDPAHDLICGERHDALRQEEGQWKLLRRLVLLSHTSLNTRNLAIFL